MPRLASWEPGNRGPLSPFLLCTFLLSPDRLTTNRVRCTVTRHLAWFSYSFLLSCAWSFAIAIVRFRHLARIAHSRQIKNAAEDLILGLPISIPNSLVGSPPTLQLFSQNMQIAGNGNRLLQNLL